MLNSDELGEKGESRFREICADAKLICNKADRDRTGWDFIVEFPFDDSHEIKKNTLDNRPSPFSCHIQVKTLLASSDDFKMRLSSAERLAKEQKPSFVFIFKVNEKLEFSDAFLIHLLDDRLVTILKRLRLEESKGTQAKKLNKKTISLRPNDVERLDPSGASLSAALKLVSKGGMHSYILQKKEQLEKLGFDPRPYEGKMTLHFENNDDIADVFLGLKKVRVSKFSTIQKRFGIKLPQQTDLEGMIKIEPNASDQCSIIIRKNSIDVAAIFDADLFFPSIPFKGLQKKKFLLTSHLFKMTVEWNHQKTHFTFSFDINNKKLPVEAWKNFWSMLLVFSEGQGSIEIRPKNLPSEVSLSISEKSGNLSAEKSEYFIDLCNRTSDLFKIAGLPTSTEISIENIEAASQDIVLASALFASEDVSISFKATQINELDKIETEKVIYAKALILGDVVIAYYGTLKLTATNKENYTLLESKEFNPGALRILRNFNEDFEAFIKKASSIEGSTNILRYEYVDGKSL